LRKNLEKGLAHFIAARFALSKPHAKDHRARTMRINITQPIYEQVRGDPDVEEQCPAFMLNMEFNDNTLKDFGS
jgi:hypothetical protein